MLDENFRKRVGTLAAADEARLDDEARERIVRRTMEEVPRLAARTRRLRAFTVVAAPLLAAAAAAVLFMGHRSNKGDASAPAVVADAPACSTRDVSASATHGFVRDDAGQKLDLGVTAFARASADADVRLVEVSPCRTVLDLASGTVTVHAKNLAGGELSVRTHDGEVRVHGTLFAVTEAGDALSVEVVEGRVQVLHDAASVMVGAGERVLASKLGVARGPLGSDRARDLRAEVLGPEVVGFDALKAVDTVKEERKPSFGAPPRSKTEAETVELPSTPDTDLLAQAEAARRIRDYDRARELYRQAAQAGGATGEAAWVALARMELGLGRAQAALDATRQRREHFGQGTLGPEALWIDVRSYRLSGDQVRARSLAQELVRTWPSSPQARAAEQWLSGR